MTETDVFVVGPGAEDADRTGADGPGLDTPDGRSGVPGTYVLLVELSAAARVEVGALGSFEFPPGTYAYVGSAFGSGGLSRVDRHRAVAAGDREVRHWHVDYLTGRPETTLRAAVLAPRADAECAVARALSSRGCRRALSSRGCRRARGDGRVPGFGSSDCACRSHLARVPGVRTARSVVEWICTKG